MSIHTARIDWERRGSAFTDNRYSREHTWRFDGGLVVPASSSPQVVFCGAQAPGAADVAALHHGAHGECFLANSVRTEIAIAGRWEYRP